MTKREVMQRVLAGEAPPYVPWSISLTHEAAQKLRRHYQIEDLDPILQDHMVAIGTGSCPETVLGNGLFRDGFGVVWDRSVDKDIGTVTGCVLAAPTLKGYQFPDPRSYDHRHEAHATLARHPDRLRVFGLGFSLYERAWTLRGMEALMVDLHENPAFVRELLHAIGDYNIAMLRDAFQHDIDMVHFGDDWGCQRGLQMGPGLWREFVYPELQRMYRCVNDAGCVVSIHSCGDVDELFDDLIRIGVKVFNPFQPEVMDVPVLMQQYRGRLVFHGGLSTQRVLPFATAAEVKAECERLLEMGRAGGYIFAPAHAVEGDVPVENVIAMIESVTAQHAFRASGPHPAFPC